MTTLREALREVVEAIESLHRCDNATQRGGMWRRLHEAEEHARAALAASPGDPAAPSPAPEEPTPGMACHHCAGFVGHPDPREACIRKPGCVGIGYTIEQACECIASILNRYRYCTTKDAEPEIIQVLAALRAARGGGPDSPLVRLLKAQIADWKKAAEIREAAAGERRGEGWAEHRAYGRGLARAAELIEECIRASRERKG
jgi:hypothetical protein